MIERPDVDFDIQSNIKISELFPNSIKASQLYNDELVSHNTGYYFQFIPKDEKTGFSAFPFKIAENYFGYYKVDFISNRVYDLIKDENHLEDLISRPIDWNWFLNTKLFDNNDPKYILTHLGGYHYLCEKYPPSSIMDIAILIALIRPRKKYMIGWKWERIKDNIWKKLDNEQGFFFKKSHAVAFAHLVIIHAQLILEHLTE